MEDDGLSKEKDRGRNRTILTPRNLSIALMVVQTLILITSALVIFEGIQTIKSLSAQGETGGYEAMRLCIRALL